MSFTIRPATLAEIDELGRRVAADNPRAQAFYRRNRFVADGRTQTEEFFDEPIDEIRMVRSAQGFHLLSRSSEALAS